MKVINKVALVALLGTLFFSTAFAVSPEFRSGTLNMLFNTFDDSLDIRISSQTVSERVGLEDLRPSWLPTDYELVEEDGAAGSFWTYYRNDQGDRLDIDLSTGASFDTEGASVEAIQIHGLPAYLIDQTNINGESHGIIKVIVVNEAQGYILSVMSIPHTSEAPVLIGRDEIIQIAKSIFD